MEKIINELNKKNKYNVIKLIHDFFIANDKKELEINETGIKNANFDKKNLNIYINYLKNPKLIFKDKGNDNDENIILLFKQINDDIDKGNNIIFPFLDICPNLVKAYIESNLDDVNIYNNENKQAVSSINDSFYLKTFEKLKNNCFISKEVLFPIYDYFKYLYDIVTKKIESEDNELIFKKFDKIKRLFEIFYQPNDIKDKNISSFCFIGGSINITFDKLFQLSKVNEIFIQIFFLNYDYLENLNDNSNIVKINENEIKYKDLKGKIDLYKSKAFIIKINENIMYKFNEKIVNINPINKLKEIKTISLLEDFYGQISSIELSIIEEKEVVQYQFLPFSIRNDNTIYYIKKKIISNNETKNINNNNNIIPKIIISNKNLVNVNYINYNDKKLNIIDYFGGIIHFLPFYKIFKNIGANNKYITKEKINHFLNFLIKKVICKLFSTYQWKKIFKRYACLVYYLLLDLDFDLENFLNEFEKEIDNNNIFYYIEFLVMIYYNQRNCKNKDELKPFIDNRDNQEETDLKIFIYRNKTLNQLYKGYMKSLFCFNNYWSNRNIFFPKKHFLEKTFIKSEVKYKQLNYYTKNFQFPYLYPILEYSSYFPNFSLYKGKDTLFKDDNRNILEYDIKLDINLKAESIIKLIFSNNYNIIGTEKCCVVKNTHHIFGELSLIRKKYNQKEKNFELIFQKSNEEKENQENIDNNKIIIEELNNKNNNKFCLKNKNNNLCYGSVFPCPEREYNRTIIIKSKYILFLLIRVYYHRVSALEIFTINKSYYFNFQNILDINNLKANKILNEIINNSFFKKIKMKNEKLIIGYYNIKYKPYLFPLFEDEINNWDKKINYYNSYDILTLTNIFSNRSFRDVFQYPIFPALYDLIGIKRELNDHIGLQENIPESMKRRDLFLKTFVTNDEDREINEDMFIFSIHNSNPAFIFNYLLRIFPYTFLSIEFQGENFDDPNRLFFSVEKTLRSSLHIKSDLREMIPELYYMIELFYNINNVFFGKTQEGKLIDEVLIKDNEKISYNKKKENFAKYLYNMRKNLEDRHINKWIDLIFGINQKYYVLGDHKYKYYDDNSLIIFETNEKILENELVMDMVSFGLVPFQLFNKKFPSIKQKDKDMLNKINSLNIELFKDEHRKINSPIQSFLCKGRILIDDNYLKIVNQKVQLSKLENFFNIPENIAQKISKKLKNETIFNNPFNSIDKENEENNEYILVDTISLVNYYFIGDIYGNILIYSLEANFDENDKENEFDKNKEYREENEEILKYGSFEIMTDHEANILKENKNVKEIFNLIQNKIDLKIKNYNLQVKLFKILSNHTKEIEYIDFNARLNILLTYSLDQFINIYIFPKFKLINAIDVNSFKIEDDENIFDEVVLISFPFPSIVCFNKNYIYQLTINGDLIKFEKLEDNDKIILSIDKNLGIIEDKIEIYNSNDILKSVFNYFT